MSDEAGDPRVYFASERTLLAWVRTGLAVIGLGFVVTRFGLFLDLITQGRGTVSHASWTSTYIGVGMVILGSLSLLLAAWQHQRFCQTLPQKDQPKPYWNRWPVWFAVLMAVIGLSLAAHLLFQSGSNSST